MRRILLAGMIFFLLFIALGIGIFRFGLGRFINDIFQNLEGASWYIEHEIVLTLVVVGLFAVTFSLLGFFLARRRGRNPFAWLTLCFFFSFWAFIILLLLPATAKRSGGDISNIGEGAPS